MTDNYCGGKTRSGSPCKRPAGWGTDHVGTGKCKLHGGASKKGVESATYEHGRYSKYAPQPIGSKVKELEAYPLLDLADELQQQRGLFATYLERFQNGYPLQEQNISAMMSWLNSIGVMVERMMKIRNDTALTGAEIALLKVRTADLVVKYIDDPDKRRAFVRELFQIDEPARLE